MAFKRHSYGDQNNRPESENLEAKFHQSIKGLFSRKQQGYIMGAFRESLAEFKITVEKKE